MQRVFPSTIVWASDYPSGQACAEEPAVRCLVRKTAHGSETKVDRSGSEIAGFQMHPVPEDPDFAERQPRLGTIPLHEFFDRVAGSRAEHRDRKAC